MAKNHYEVSIMDQKYTLLSDADEEFVNSVASYVDQKLREAMDGAPSSFKGAILAALNITEEYFLRKREVETKSRDLIELIDK